jgi:CheY-like chemotaxis protein
MELVRLMNGVIEVTSQVDVGSEFTIVLPVNVETLTSQPLEKPVRRFSGQKFLIVDPCSAARRCLEQTIADYGGFAISFDTWFDKPLLDRPNLELFDGVIAAGIEAADLLDQASELGICNWLAQAPDASQQANRNYLIKPCVGHEWIAAMELVFSKSEPNTTAKSCRNLTPPKYDSEPSKRPNLNHRLKILVAEDGIVNQCVLVGLLELSGHLATVANNGREAAELLEHQQFDLVLMDLDMPELDGVQATRLIRSRRISIPIYAMTAHHDQQHADQCHQAGMNGFLTKPINPNDLQRIMTEVARADVGKTLLL